jgi:Ulp1 family protease
LRTKDGVQEGSRWMQRQNINVFSKHLIMFPINYDRVHWSLCAICNLQNLSLVFKEGVKHDDVAIPMIIHLDSYGIHNTGEIGNIVQAWLKHEFEL